MTYFAASVDAPETNRKFAESLGLDYPILSDPEKSTARAYGVLMKIGLASRWTFYIGVDGKVLLVDQDVSPGSAGADVARRLQELGIKKRS